MKKLIVLLIALSVMLSGCSWMNGSYISVTPHVVTPDKDPDDSIPVSTYAQLRIAISDLVDSGSTHGLFALSDYPQDQILTDVEQVIQYILLYDPIGAYAVETIDYEYGSDSPQSMLSVDITYRRTEAEIRRIQTVRGISGAETAIASALRNCESSVVLQIINYADTDFAQLSADYAAAHPEIVMETPQVTFQVYPASGDIRVVEMIFNYQTSRESLRTMQSTVSPVFSSAQLYVTAGAEPQVKYEQLYTFLTERFDYSIETSITPSYSLLCHGVGDSKAFAQVYAAMCRQVGLECQVVSGTKDGESYFWNIISDGDTYYHVDLLRSTRDGGYRQYGDEAMQGYVWDYSAYPVCGTPVQPPAE